MSFVEFDFPDRFASLDDIYDFVQEADVTHLTQHFRWDVLQNEADFLALDAEFHQEDEDETIFHLNISISRDNRLRYELLYVEDHTPEMVNRIFTEFVPAFHRFPRNYTDL